MSLLMDALKKAERAKQGQSGQAGETLEMQTQAEGRDEEISLFPTEHPTPSMDEKNGFPPNISTCDASAIPELTLMPSPEQDDTAALTEPALSTEERTATIPTPATISNDNLDFLLPPKAPFRAAADDAPRPTSRTDNRQTPARNDRNIAATQQKAKSVFTAKQPAHHRTRLLAGAVVAMILGGAAFGAYYWKITSNNASIPPAGLPPQAAIQVPAPVVDTTLPPNHGEQPTPPENLTPIQALPKSDRTPSQTATVAPAPIPEEKIARAAHYTGNPAIQIRQSSATSQLNPMLGKAYQSFLAGDIDIAQQQYSKALQQEANNRDALLGLAAIALNRKQSGQATAYYLKLLELNPADPDALAGLVGLQGQTDPVQSESRLKKILVQNPQAAALHFALGNVYTQQSRWAEAQQSYFRAYSSAPSNADYVYNLAISLDHLGQGKLALEYYQRAIALSMSGPANFDKAAAQNRIMDLQQPAGN